MPSSIVIRVLLTWLLFLPVPIANGALRELWYKALMGERAAHQIGVPILCFVFLGYAYVSLRGEVAALSTPQLWSIGILWLTLTLAFEFGMGLAAGRSWSYMLADYRIWEGRIWPVVPLVVLVSPLIVRKLA
jgi:hypothetical protein